MAGPGDVVLRTAERLDVVLRTCVGVERSKVVGLIFGELAGELLKMPDADAFRVVAAFHRAASLAGSKKENKEDT